MTTSSTTASTDHEICVAGSDIFKNYLDMPVWQLRHLQVSRFIEKHQISKVLDIGCAEGTLINRLSRSYELEKLIGIDFDQKVLKSAQHNVQPQLIQDSIGFSRQKPLTIELYNLNILEALPLHLFEQIQLVTLIEFIEHINQKDLQSLCDQVFLRIQPQYSIITTPNSQFNVHFKFKAGQMRHPDHLFQWDRKQFQEFVNKICLKYNYSHQIFGIGEHTTNDKFGFSSQGAYFTKTPRANQNRPKLGLLKQVQPFTSVRYPFWKDKLEGKVSNQLYSVIIKNNYMSPAVILESFLQTKLGKKILSSKSELSGSGLDVDLDEKWVIKQSKQLKYCGYDQERNEIFYDYEDSRFGMDEEIDEQFID